MEEISVQAAREGWGFSGADFPPVTTLQNSPRKGGGVGLIRPLSVFSPPAEAVSRAGSTTLPEASSRRTGGMTFRSKGNSSPFLRPKGTSQGSRTSPTVEPSKTSSVRYSPRFQNRATSSIVASAAEPSRSVGVGYSRSRAEGSRNSVSVRKRLSLQAPDFPSDLSDNRKSHTSNTTTFYADNASRHAESQPSDGFLARRTGRTSMQSLRDNALYSEAPLVVWDTEAESSSSERGDSDASDDDDSCMEWEEDQGDETLDEDVSISDSESEDETIHGLPTGKSIMDLPLRQVNAKFLFLNRKLARLQNVRKHAQKAKSRARRLDHHVNAERYTSSLYRQLLRKTQTDLSSSEKAKTALEAELEIAQEAKTATDNRLYLSAQSLTLVSGAKRKAEGEWDLERQASQKERDKTAAALRLAEQGREAAESGAAISSRNHQQRYDALVAEKEAVERQRAEMETRMNAAQTARKEADKKLAMIREAHDFERTSYLDQIRTLKEQLKVKMEGGA